MILGRHRFLLLQYLYFTFLGHVLKDIKCGMNLVLTLSGPFLTESGEKGINVSSRQENKLLEVWIDYSDENDLGSTDVLEHSKVVRHKIYHIFYCNYTIN